MTSQQPFRSRGFTLTEIAIAIGLAAFCLVAILGLLPAGLHSNRVSLEQTQASALLTAIEDDLRSLTDFTELPESSPRFGLLLEPVQPLQSLFIGEDGSPTDVASARYRVTVRGPQLIPGSSRGPLAASVLVTWPAAADPNPTAWPIHAQGQLESLVMIRRP